MFKGKPRTKIAPALWVTVKNLVQSSFGSLIKIWKRKKSRKVKGMGDMHKISPTIVPMAPRATHTCTVVIILMNFRVQSVS